MIVGPGGSSDIKNLKKSKFKFKFFVLVDKNTKESKMDSLREIYDQVIKVDFMSDQSILSSIKDIRDRVVGVTSLGESSQKLFEKIVPFFPLLKLPLQDSLRTTTNKLKMRSILGAYSEGLNPKYSLIDNNDKNTLDNIEKKIGYPMIVKPVNLTSSKLVNMCHHREDLEKSVSLILRKNASIQKDRNKILSLEKTEILVEEFMDGSMYSIDGVVDSRGEVSLYPLVYVKTGMDIGFDDFFGYYRITPVNLKEEVKVGAFSVTKKVANALSLRSTHFHLELKKTENGEWKVIEIGPRYGGYRRFMYDESFGIDQLENEIYLKTDESKIDVLGNEKSKYSCVMQIFSETEGIISNISGLKKIKELDSIIRVKQNKKKGDRVKFAKNGGGSVFNIFLVNKDRQKLIGDLRRVRDNLKIS